MIWCESLTQRVNTSRVSFNYISPILERNNLHIGVNIVGASQIHGSFETFADIYSYG